MDDMFEVIGSALAYLGYSPFSDDEGELMEAKEVLLLLQCSFFPGLLMILLLLILWLGLEVQLYPFTFSHSFDRVQLL